MKKRIAIIASLVLIVSLCYFGYNITIKSIRYATPIQSFEKSCPANSVLVDTLEDNGIAMLIYKKRNGASATHIISQNQNGWTSVLTDYKNIKQVMQDDGFINYKIVEGKYVIDIQLVVDDDKEICDSLNSSILTGLYNLDSGRKLFCALLVTHEKLPDDYRIFFDNQEISIY